MRRAARPTRGPKGPPRIGIAALLLALGLPAAGGAQEEGERVLEVCPVEDASRMQVGIEGIVRDDESEVPLPRATVILRYEEERDLPTPPDVTTQTDAQGRYRMCGLEAFREVRVRATYSVRRGKERKVELDRSQFVDLEVDVGDAAFLVFSVVAAEDGRPVEGARVQFSPIPLAGITDSLGRVAFRAIPPGVYGLAVRHIAFAPRDEEISVLGDQTAELRVELITQAITVAPLEVQITGRDPYLLTSGFYERRASIEDGYFGTYPEIKSYTTLGTFFRFKRELSVRYRRSRIILLNGRPASRLGYNSTRELNEIKFSRVRGIEVYPCHEAPPEIMNQVPDTVVLSDCNLVAIWTR